MSALLLAALLACAPAAALDMSKPPQTGPMRPVRLPARVEWRLPNGLSVVLVSDSRARRPSRRPRWTCARRT